jgi:hypothetical protein
MRKLQAVLLALVAMSALGAIVAASASAEATLAAEWLANGAKITALLTTEATGELLLEDTKAASSVLCNGLIVGTVNSAGKDTTELILNLQSEEVTLAKPLLGTSSTGPDCIAVKGCAVGTVAKPIEVSPEGLPWTTQLVLDEVSGLFLDKVTAPAASVGYALLCTVLGVKVEDICTQAEATVEIVNDAATGDAAIPVNAISQPLANCSIGGPGTGRNEADAVSVIKLTGASSAELLTVSE